jgi:hypothetical protein
MKPCLITEKKIILKYNSELCTNIGVDQLGVTLKLQLLDKDKNANSCATL